jgi:hypothetical protein
VAVLDLSASGRRRYARCAATACGMLRLDLASASPLGARGGIISEEPADRQSTDPGRSETKDGQWERPAGPGRFQAVAPSARWRFVAMTVGTYTPSSRTRRSRGAVPVAWAKAHLFQNERSQPRGRRSHSATAENFSLQGKGGCDVREDGEASAGPCSALSAERRRRRWPSWGITTCGNSPAGSFRSSALRRHAGPT